LEEVERARAGVGLVSLDLDTFGQVATCWVSARAIAQIIYFTVTVRRKDVPFQAQLVEPRFSKMLEYGKFEPRSVLEREILTLETAK
jgi:hypothetical protein